MARIRFRTNMQKVGLWGQFFFLPTHLYGQLNKKKKACGGQFISEHFLEHDRACRSMRYNVLIISNCLLHNVLLIPEYFTIYLSILLFYLFSMWIFFLDDGY